MKVNFFVEDMLFFKYIGCATAARSLFHSLGGRTDIDIAYNSRGGPFDLVHYHTFGPFALFHKKRHNGVSVLTAHSTPRVNENNIAFSRFINRQYPRIYGSFDHIVTISESCRKEVEALVPGVPTTLIPNGVDRDFFIHDSRRRQSFREAYGISDDAQVVLTVAQQTPRKGIYDIMACAQRHPDITWVWVGGFPYGIFSKEYFAIQRAKRASGPNMIFTGFVPDIRDAYSAADIFCMPSYAETFGLVILEALSSGLPVIARDIPEFREIFSDDLMYFTDPDGISELLADPLSHRRYREHARDATERFDIHGIAERHVELYRALADG
ncbi:MAG: glycosyltransferase family 4 protein [Methanomicrobiaceae archaeon]|nr:glycosyltransferase family 4 protein [Methanomicrobiaceae archaeon]